MVNKKGQSTGLAIMGLIFFAVIGLTVVNLFFNDIDTARAELNCASPDDISDGSKLTCLVVDLVLPYWIWIVLSVAIGFVLVKVAL